MTFWRFRDGDIVDADREGLAAWLARRQLTIGEGRMKGGLLFTPDGAQLRLDGSPSDLTLDPLDQDASVTAAIGHARLGPEECELMVELCDAWRFLIMNGQGSPAFLIVGDHHRPEDIFEGMLEYTVHVRDARELQADLSGEHERFLEYRDQVLRTAAEDPRDARS